MEFFFGKCEFHIYLLQLIQVEFLSLSLSLNYFFGFQVFNFYSATSAGGCAVIMLWLKLYCWFKYAQVCFVYIYKYIS